MMGRAMRVETLTMFHSLQIATLRRQADVWEAEMKDSTSVSDEKDEMEGFIPDQPGQEDDKT